MKKVLPPSCPEVIVHPSQADEDKYYGVLAKTDGTKGFVYRYDYRKGDYAVLCQDAITKGNHFMACFGTFHATLPILLEAFSKSPSFEVFEFDSYQELFKWLANS